MSAAERDEDEKLCCASCGIAGIDDVKLKDCDGCDLVRYCSDECQELHRPEHAGKCRKRAAELRDEILFKQPESRCDGDCPICCLPIPIDPKKSAMMSCCSKIICKGCTFANFKREDEGRLQHKCPFCRKTLLTTKEENNEQRMKRVEANDPVAMRHMGTAICHKGDYKAAFECFTKAATLGDAAAHYQLSCLYEEGRGVEKDEKKELHHLTEAAIGGNPSARHNLGCVEGNNGRMDRAAKHFIIAAKLGHDDSLGAVKDLYKDGYVSKDDFAEALRGHHAAIVATKSPQREEAEKFFAERLAKR